jgi:predicted O-methyltransferase YrrM
MTALPTVKKLNRFNLPPRNYMHHWEFNVFLTILDEIQPKRMLELGVNEGITTRAILDHIKSLEYYLGVDVSFDHPMPIPGQQSEVPRVPGRYAKDDPRFELFIREGGIGDPPVSEPFDVVFIDGDHSYLGVLRDYDLARRVTHPGGWIFFHDYNNETVQVTEALNKLHEEGSNIFHIADTWLAYEQV